jgi:hypothetical protein
MSKPYRKVRDTQKPFIFESDFTDVTGQVYWSRSYYTPLIFNGSVPRFLLTLEDVTELKGQQDSLENALSDLVSEVAEVCRSCDKVKGQENRWVTMSEYLTEKTPEPISHSICPTCSKHVLS